MEEINGRSLLLLNREWRRLQDVIDARAAEAREYRNEHGEEETPAMCTGLLVKRVQVTGKRADPVTTTTYTLDVKTLRAARSLEQFAMKFFLEPDRQEAPECLPIVTAEAADLSVSLTVRHSPAAPAQRPEQAKRAA
jgi:hypothetical protein